jgi:DNA-binding LacI/PurR family transcriptional regulator
LNGHTDEPDYRRLLHDVRTHKLAGILFASSPHLLLKTPLYAEIMARTELSKVAWMSRAAYPDMPIVASSDPDYLRRALDFFRTQGCRRLAVIGTAHMDGGGLMPHETELAAEAARHGLEVRPYWVQAMHASLASRTRPLAQLLMQGASDERPDALLILDDSLVEAATAGVADAGLTGTDDVTILGHANFPEPPFSAVPITRLGFDVEDVLAKCLDVMDRQRRGEAVADVTPVAAAFANDGNAGRRKSAA